MKVQPPFIIEINRKRPNVRQPKEQVTAVVYALKGKTYEFLRSATMFFSFDW